MKKQLIPVVSIIIISLIFTMILCAADTERTRSSLVTSFTQEGSETPYITAQELRDFLKSTFIIKDDDTLYWSNDTYLDSSGVNELQDWINELGANSLDSTTIKNITCEKIIKSQYRTPQCLVTFEFDDGLDDHYNEALSLFNTQGEVAQANIITSRVGNANFMTWSEIQALDTAGWEIAHHGNSTASFDTLTKTEIIAEWDASNDSFSTHGITANNFVVPYSNTNELVRRIGRKYFRSIRTGGSEINDKVIEQYDLNSIDIDTAADSATWHTYLDSAESKNRWVIFFMHSISDTDKTVLNSLIDTCQARSLPIVTTNQALDSLENMAVFGEGFEVGQQGVRLNYVEGDIEFHNGHIYIKEEDGGDIGAGTEPQLIVEGNTDSNSVSVSTAIEVRGNGGNRARGVYFTTADDTDEWFIGAPYDNWYDFTIGYTRTADEAEKAANSKFYIDGGTGNIGIHDVTPSYKLDVDGNINAADTVFSNYSTIDSVLSLEPIDTADVSTPAEGMIIWDDSDNKAYGYDGTSWNSLW